MLTADARSPAVFPSLFGVTAAEFEALFADDEAARDRLRAASRTTRRGTPRVRKSGGDTPDLDDRTQLMLALFWLRVYPTYLVLGFFARHTTNARHTPVPFWPSSAPSTTSPATTPTRPPARRPGRRTRSWPPSPTCVW